MTARPCHVDERTPSASASPVAQLPAEVGGVVTRPLRQVPGQPAGEPLRTENTPAEFRAEMSRYGVPEDIVVMLLAYLARHR